MKISIKILMVISISLPVIHIILSFIGRYFGLEFYGNIFSLLKLFLIPLGLSILLWYFFSVFIAKKLILIIHYLIYRNRNRPKSIYFFTSNDYPLSIGNYLRESLYPTALFFSILMFIIDTGANLIQEVFSISFNIFTVYFFDIILIFPILSTLLIAPIKLIDWSGFRYYNSKRNAIFQVGLKVGTLFNSITGMAVILSVALSFLSFGLEFSLRIAFSILFYILPLNIILIIIMNFYILPKKRIAFKKTVIKDKKYKISPEHENVIIKFEKNDSK
ncbi:MAG: hypothetical protein ACTSQO_04280 [Candidatus Helarchaeota archaeon]